jgi:hypothetical protein
MKLPAKLLKQVAGPLLASTALSCASPADQPIEPILPIAAADDAPRAEAPDPVSYDPDAEADRIARTEALVASRDVVRDARIDAKEEADEARRRRARAQVQLRRHVYIACGRG